MSISEILFLGLLGLAIVGPKLLELVQQAGKIGARWKKISHEFQSHLAADISATANDLAMQQALAEVGLVETDGIQARHMELRSEKWSGGDDLGTHFRAI